MLRWFEWFSVVSCMALVGACGTETPSDLIPDGGAADGGGLTGNPSGCVPATCSSLGYTCGASGDGCGGVLNCGSCAPGDVCGGAGYNLCGGPSSGCTKATCQSLGFNCGPAGDGCGGLVQCGGCASPSTCGGGGQASVCGPGGPCTGLCKQQVACPNGVLTTLSGVVLAGTDPALYGSPDPVPNVVVYVPNAPLTPFTRGVQCSQCGADVSGAPLVSTRTAYDGSFTLTNVPVGTGIPVVIQLGRWRRTFHIDVTQACAVTSVPALVMPHNQSEGDIPLTAISTGAVDSLECVLRKMGVDEAEFTKDSGSASGYLGRIHLYAGGPGTNVTGYGSGATAGVGTRPETALLGASGRYMDYDQIVLPCWGQAFEKDATSRGNLVTFGNSGGRIFATHYSYTWLHQTPPFSQTAQWHVDQTPLLAQGVYSSIVGNVNEATNPRGTVFANWLAKVGALSKVTPPEVTISYPRHDLDAVNPGAVDWIDGSDPQTSGSKTILHYAFDLPWGQASQCGRTVYSDFHVENKNQVLNNGVTFPLECTPGPMSSQEKTLEYMFWDLASCVPPPSNPSPTGGCTPRTCQDQHLGCGQAGDGCGNVIQCGDCAAPQTCGGGGTFAQCGGNAGGDAGVPPTCTPQTCASQGAACGPTGDGCGNLLQCGTCPLPTTCGGGGLPAQCGGVVIN